MDGTRHRPKDTCWHPGRTSRLQDCHLERTNGCVRTFCHHYYLFYVLICLSFLSCLNESFARKPLYVHVYSHLHFIPPPPPPGRLSFFLTYPIFFHFSRNLFHFLSCFPSFSGVFEFDAFAKGTFGIATTLAELTSKGCITIIGGGG